MMKKQNGFTLVEILVAMSIIVILAIAMTGAFNPILNIDRAGDARRKKDLNRIKVAFEEYYNDNGHFPGNLLVEKLNTKTNCGSSVFAPWLSTWPCDPNGDTYYVAVETDSNGIKLDEPKWFKVFADLRNRKDTDINNGWYSGVPFPVGNGDKSNEEVNFCVSSTNETCLGYEGLMSQCSLDTCYVMENGDCKGAGEPFFPNNSCTGDNCYARYIPEGTCSYKCKVSCCGSLCD